MRTMKGIGVLLIEVTTLDATNPDCNTTIGVSWVALGETYQLERSLDATTWTTVYTGTAVTFNDTVANSDQIYYYRVKVVGETVYSNVDSVQVYLQNKFLYDVGCFPAFNVAPYNFRKMYRSGCGEIAVDAPNGAVCKDPNLCAGTTSTIENPVDVDSRAWNCKIHLGFITATKICIKSECIKSGSAATVNWRYLPDNSDNWGLQVMLGYNMSNAAGNIEIYSANVSLNGTVDVYLQVHSYAQTDAGRGEHKILAVSWG